VLGFIKLYCEEVDCGVVGTHFSGAKVDFLRVMLDYEHYVPLNIPIEPNFGTSIKKLLECFDSLQFFSSLVIREIGGIIKATIDEKHSPVRLVYVCVCVWECVVFAYVCVRMCVCVLHVYMCVYICVSLRERERVCVCVCVCVCML
jgi:hypothetical protein